MSSILLPFFGERAKAISIGKRRSTISCWVLSRTGQSEFYSVDIAKAGPLPKDRPVFVDANDGELTSAGWAVDHQAKSGARGVYVGIDGRREVRAVYGLERKDVASFYSNPRYAASGFVVSIPTSLMEKGRHTLTLKVLRADRQGYYETDQRIDVDVQ